MDTLVLPIVVGIGVIGIVSGIMVFARNYIKAEPNEALIFTGRKDRATGRGWSQNDSVALKSVDSKTALPDIAIEPNELEAIIESILDKKLKPITRMLADIRQTGPSVEDIFAGIGYIFGLVGIAAYVHSRKKKE